jgi:hypothetical protein
MTTAMYLVRCEHYGWKLIAAHVSTIVHGQKWLMIACRGCGAYRCLDAWIPAELKERA